MPNIPTNSEYNVYIGARYVPKLDGNWSSEKEYEPLTIVSYQGNSYTSKTFVPAGTLPTDSDYWALTGNYNAQIEQYRQEVETLQNNVNDIINSMADVTLLGISNDGVTDVTKQLQELFNNNDYSHIYFPDGKYLAKNLTINKNVTMSDNAYFIYNGYGEDTFITINGDNLSLCLNIDCNNKNPLYAADVSGSNIFISCCHIKNLTYNGSQPANSGLHCNVNKLFIDRVYIENFVSTNTSPKNDSCPQGVTLDLKCTNVMINELIGNTTRALIVDYSENAELQLSNINSYNCLDNVVYINKGDQVNIGNINSCIANEVVAVITDGYETGIRRSSINVGTINSYSAEFIIRHTVCDSILIGNINARGVFNDILLTANESEAYCNTLIIGNINVEAICNGIFFCPADRGSIGRIMLGNIHINAYYKKSSGGSLLSFMRLDNADEVSIDNLTFKFIDMENTISTGTRISLQLKDGLERISKIGQVTFTAFDSSQNNMKDIIFRITNATQNMLKVVNGIFNTSQTYIEFYGDRMMESYCCITNVPTVGTFRKGFILYDLSGNHFAYICTAKGSPGTWKTID